jgi:hypothetical protein
MRPVEQQGHEQGTQDYQRVDYRRIKESYPEGIPENGIVLEQIGVIFKSHKRLCSSETGRCQTLDKRDAYRPDLEQQKKYQRG